MTDRAGSLEWKASLARVRKQGKKLGRPVGRKDKGKRKRTEYLLRYAGKD